MKPTAMSPVARFVSAAVLSGAAMLSAIPLVAQVPETSGGGQAVSATDGATRDLTLAEVEAALAAIEADAGIDDAVKGLLRPKYKQAIDALKEAADFAASAADYREAIDTAAERAAKPRAELRALPSAESAAKVTATGSTEDLQREIDSRWAARNALNDQLSKLTSELARVKGRPEEISVRSPIAQRELSDVGSQLASPELAEDVTSPGRVADRVVLRAARSRLVSELEMLKQEQSSLSVREDLLQAQHDLLTRQLENATAALDSLEALLHGRLTSDAKRVSSLTDTLPQDVPEADEAAQELAAEVQVLAEQFESVVESVKKVKPAQDDVTTRLNDLTNEYESIREQLELGGGGKAMVKVLFDLQSRALNARADMDTVQLPALDETRLAALQIRDKLRRQPDLERQFADHSSDAVTRLVAARREVLEKLRTQYAGLIRALAELNEDKEQYLDEAEEVRAYIAEQLFGFRFKSCPPISLETLTDLPGGLGWALGADHWEEIGQALLGSAERMPVRSLGIVLVVALLLLFRPRIGSALERTGVKIRRISSDRYAHTSEALLWTSLLAIPVPLLIAFAGWALGQTAKPSDWLRGLAGGLGYAAQITLAMGFLAALCRPGGLGTSHFGWSEERLTRFRRAILGFTAFYVPAFLLTSSCAYGAASDYFDSVGRVSFILAHVWTAVVLWRLLQGPSGVLATFTREHPTSLVTRWRHLWLPVLLALPLLLVVFASLGYLITAMEFSLGLVTTLTLIAGGSVLYGLALRWFTINQRKLALAEAIEKRRARQEAAACEEPQEQAGEVVSVGPEDERELDLDSISEKTRALLRLLFSLAVGVAIIVFWSQTFPLIAVVESIPIPLTRGLTLLGLMQVVLILVVTYFVVQNLPGLLELGVLRTKTIDAGTRTAITTLCQYAVIAVGLVVLFNVLHVDWARFGWIAAALSVGLGFGLQEVVANFVCGLILLFERPIRVGDVVTVEGMTGTVTKIHMRATTITNWDRQEFVVPNKTAITNTLLNWTLSAPVNRIVITVGVAYGSDTEKARQIMLDAAAEHPLVLDDPAPMATFEQFAESSLTLILRAYLPDLDNRLKTITDLHTEIGKRFAAAGIEIAFPQQDLHLRSGWVP